MANGDASASIGTAEISAKDLYNIYESGKGRRYSLLFAVHGAAFAIFSFLVKDAGDEAFIHISALLISVIMIVFTWLMWSDIDAFGRNMARLGKLVGLDLYGAPGQQLLKGLAVLLIVAWLALASIGLWHWRGSIVT